MYQIDNYLFRFYIQFTQVICVIVCILMIINRYKSQYLHKYYTEEHCVLIVLTIDIVKNGCVFFVFNVVFICYYYNISPKYILK